MRQVHSFKRKSFFIPKVDDIRYFAKLINAFVNNLRETKHEGTVLISEVEKEKF